MGNSNIEAPRLSAKMSKEIDWFLEDLYEDGKTKEAGQKLAVCKMDKSQVRGLENLVVSTTRFSEIINYIKNQVGKEKKENKWRNVGEEFLSQLKSIEAKATEIAGDDPATRLEVKLRLARGWARQVVAHYLYDAKDERGRHDIE